MYSSTTQTFIAPVAPVAPDPPLITALEAVPTEDWCRTWPAERTIMLRMTSKRVRKAVNKMHPPAVVCLCRKFWEKRVRKAVDKMNPR